MKQNKIAGFWIRLGARLFDVAVFAGFTILVAYLVLKKVNGEFQFQEPWTFYVWVLISILLLLFFFIFMPIIRKDQTLGMLVFRIKLIFEKQNQKIISLLKREAVFALAWVFNLLVLLVVINHTLINKIVIDQKVVSYSTTESIRIGVFTSFGSIIFLTQWIFAFSTMVKKDKLGFHDKISNSKIVYKYKFRIINKAKPLMSFWPFMVDNKKVEWIN